MSDDYTTPTSIGFLRRDVRRQQDSEVPAADPVRRERILAGAAATLERLKWQAYDHEVWLNDPDRRETAEAAQEWIDELNKRKSGASWL